jgi:uncharacterized protein (TIGR03067 family)
VRADPRNGACSRRRGAVCCPGDAAWKLDRDQGGTRRQGRHGRRGAPAPFTGDRFEIRSKDGRTVVYTGTFRTDQNAKPASIDFVNTEGTDKGKTWRGIYTFDGDTLTTCDNAPDVAKARPTAFEAKSGSGYILVTFARARP